MIISASRRTDIPAFYGDWLIRRIRAGFCDVPNPYNASQVSVVDLRPGAVDCIVFWTRHAVSLLPHLDELTQRGYRFMFLYTILDYPEELELRMPAFERRMEMVDRLASQIGSGRIVWRYDPVYLSAETDVEFHCRTFERIARRMAGIADRVVISYLDRYAKVERSLNALAGTSLAPADGQEARRAAERLTPELVRIAQCHDMTIRSCAESIDLEPLGVQPGACIDAELIGRLFGIDIPSAKDRNQRPACRCAASRDIGMYDSCLFGCRYCYATGSAERARTNHARHDPDSRSLIG